MTGWKLVDSDGEVHKSWHSAIKALSEDPTLTFEEQQLDMSSTQARDATEEVRARAHKLGTAPPTD